MANHQQQSTPFARAAAEAWEVLGQAASLIDAERRRLRVTIDEAGVPSPVKSAVHRLDDLVDTARREAGSATATVVREVSEGLEQLRGRVSEAAPSLAENGRRVIRGIGLDSREPSTAEAVDQPLGAEAGDGSDR